MFFLSSLELPLRGSPVAHGGLGVPTEWGLGENPQDRAGSPFFIFSRKGAKSLFVHLRLCVILSFVC
ncbi:hypothetical protein SD80_018195 [Scytonema tolypothrichoides VB-61278]|nr:hypothetical protein SD80_018195 [Scytonema tolypothrichoides VB-61278]